MDGAGRAGIGKGHSMINIHTGRTNTETHRAVVHAEQIKHILADHVCNAAGVPRASDGTSVVVQLSSRMGSCGTEYEAVVTITVDFEKLPRASRE